MTLQLSDYLRSENRSFNIYEKGWNNTLEVVKKALEQVLSASKQ